MKNRRNFVKGVDCSVKNKGDVKRRSFLLKVQIENKEQKK